jgi:hypothetical protein
MKPIGVQISPDIESIPYRVTSNGVNGMECVNTVDLTGERD